MTETYDDPAQPARLLRYGRRARGRLPVQLPADPAEQGKPVRRQGIRTRGLVDAGDDGRQVAQLGGKHRGRGRGGIPRSETQFLFILSTARGRLSFIIVIAYEGRKTIINIKLFAFYLQNFVNRRILEYQRGKPGNYFSLNEELNSKRR